MFSTLSLLYKKIHNIANANMTVLMYNNKIIYRTKCNLFNLTGSDFNSTKPGKR